MSGSDKCSAGVPNPEGFEFWTFETAQERLVEAAALWDRAPGGGGGSSYATDAPWHLMRRINQRGDAFEFYDPRGFDMKSSDVPLKPLPLARAEIARRDEASAWVEAYVGEADRRLVWAVVRTKAAGKRPDWRQLLRFMGMTHGQEGLRKRYTRAIGALAAALNQARIPLLVARL